MHGAIEVKKFGRWAFLLDLDPLIARDYPLFGCLFGVRNALEFRPVAADRGCPDDSAARVVTMLRSWRPDAHSTSWLTWGEIKTVDSEERADVDSSPQIFRRRSDGSETYVRKGEFEPEFHRLEHNGIVEQYWTPDGRLWQEGTEWQHPNGEIYRYGAPRRRHVLNHAWWHTICRLCEVLEPDYGADNIRLVVWFDN